VSVEARAIEAWRVVGDVFAEDSRHNSAYTYECPFCGCRWKRGHRTENRDKTRLGMHLLSVCQLRSS
jgi:hypothetical protein